MPTSNHHVRERQRLDFAKIQGTIQIPNLIEVQMKSYQRFLQMDLLPSERDDGGLQSVFTSVFPIRDFREMSQLEFVDYSIGNWECKCGQPERPAPPTRHVPQLRRVGSHQSVSNRRRHLPQVRHVQQEHADLLQQVRRSGGHAIEI